MSKSVNRVQLLGNLGKDPEVRYTPAGTPVAQMSLATSYRVKGNDGNFEDRTEWHIVVLWNRLAEIAGEYLKKGSKVYIDGRNQTRSWDDKTTGQKVYRPPRSSQMSSCCAAATAVTAIFRSPTNDGTAESMAKATSSPAQKLRIFRSRVEPVTYQLSDGQFQGTPASNWRAFS